ncbi:MAG: uroporphyrinogen-III C-methyltransferase [Candidatus Thiodiazotropha sp. (ex Lucinoma borealis)]|nr:uroporphyrinogen-III C-methyltransferase [Candidatus Thiodiazotropha sp. (ex Lucinoma borealis)]
MSEKAHESGQSKNQTEAEFDNAIEGEVERIDDSRGRSGSSRLPITVAVVALLAVAAGLLFGYRYWLDMKQTLATLNSSLVQANQEQAQLGQRLQQAQQLFEQQKQEISTQRDALAEQAEKLLQEKEASRQQGAQLYRSLAEIQTRLGGKEGQWRVAEAEYLMRVANHRLTLMGDAATALEALKSADERINASGDPGWSGVREALAQEMTRLTAVSSVDMAGISAEISALANQVDALPLRDEGVALMPSSANSADMPALADNQGFNLEQLLDDLWQGFKSMMIIRHHDRPVSAMLPPEHRYFLVQNLRLKLESANAALMGRNQSLYSENLKGATEWVDHYFQISDPSVNGFLAQLGGLAARDIAPVLPDISGSLRALQAKREALHQEGAR